MAAAKAPVAGLANQSSMVDALRDGGARERELAKRELSARLKN